MSKFLDKKLESLVPYTPGEQPKMKKLIKLNTNELPYELPKSVVEKITQKISTLNRYSDPEASELSEAIANEFGVQRECVYTGNGSDEVLAFIFQALCENGAAFADLTYGFYSVFAELYGVNKKIIPLEEDFSINLKKYSNLKETIFIANPNAPTTLALSSSEIETFVVDNPQTLVVIDEAYVKFGAESCVELTKKYDNILIVGTFSKSYGLAGARLGYAIGDKELIKDLNLVKFSFNPYNTNTLTQKAGVSVLEESEYFAKCVEKICNTRDKFIEEIRKLGFVCADSKANFVFTKHEELSGEYLQNKLRENQIIVRRFDNNRIKDYLRITVGTEEEMETLLNSLKDIVGEK